MASIPATNNLPIAVNNNSNDAQMNFNPSWMQSTAPPMQRSLSVSNNSTSSVNAKKMVTENDETCEPIFAKHSYGREDLLAMMGKNTMKPPLGIKRCPFYMDTAQTPIILMPFSDTEMRLQQNMNSSKAMSTKKKTFSRVESTTKSSDIWPRRTVGIGAGGVQQQQHAQAPQAPLPLKVVASTNNNFSSTANNVATAGANPPGTNNGGTGTSNGNKKASESATPTTATTTVAATAKEPPSLATTKASGGETLPQTAPLSATAKAAHHWCYLDPTGVQRGPFDSQQMQAWFSSGYFSETLRVRRKDETTYIALGDLFLINGREAPFVVKTVTSLPSQQQTATFPTVQQQRISPSELLEANATAAGQHHHHSHISPTLVDVERIWATTPLEDAVVGAGSGGGSASASNGSTVTTAVAASAVGGGGGATAPMTMMQSKEFKILEEQRKLREKEELLRRNEIERAAKEQRVREMESELKRQQEELSRRACEKDAEFEQRRAQIAEYERNRREELVAFEQRIRAEHLQRQLQLEEDDRRRAKEMEELMLVRREQERQHQLVEAEMKRKRDDEDVRLRLAFQEQQHQQELIKKARRAEEEQRRRLIEEQQRHQQKALDEARAERTKQQQAAAKAEAAAKAMEQQRINSLANAQWQQQQHQPMVNSNSFSFNQPPPPQQPPIQPPSTQLQTRATAWQTISTPLPHPIGQSPPASFLQFPFQQEQQQPIAQQQQPPAVTEQRRGWQPVQQPKAAPIPPAINKPSSGGGGGANTKLGNKNNKQGVKHPQKGGGKQQKQQMPPPVEDKFTAWIIKRVKELNPSVDAEVFATFISGIDSPNEAEDYIIGYLGENKEVKEFHRDFLQKRIELRPRAHPQAPKDDLSRPAAAHGADSELHKGAGWASGGGACGAMANSSGIGGAAAATTAVSNANKKKQKGQKVVLDKSHYPSNKFTVLDLSTLGFRPASDPNRLNAGEIDSVPPVPGGAGNKKR